MQCVNVYNYYMLYFDDLGRKCIIDKIPQRIISLCPSITETLCDLGLSDKIIACTDYCIHPTEVVKDFDRVGGPKNISKEKITGLSPEIIFAVKEENEPKCIEKISKKIPTYVFDINSINDGIDLIRKIGLIFEVQNKSFFFVDKIQNGYKNLPKINSNKKCLYLVWKDPYIAVGGGTFIGSVLFQINLRNCLRNSEKRYPKININLLNDFDLLILPSEPYSFSENDIEGLKNIYPVKQIITVDGEMFSWYGTHQLKAISYLQELVAKLNQNISSTH